MSDLKLFRNSGNGVTEIRSESVELEKSLQTLIEANLEAMLGVRFLVSEYATGKTHGGRIDTLGIDENACPVIVEYKRAIFPACPARPSFQRPSLSISAVLLPLPDFLRVEIDGGPGFQARGKKNAARSGFAGGNRR